MSISRRVFDRIEHRTIQELKTVKKMPFVHVHHGFRLRETHTRNDTNFADICQQNNMGGNALSGLRMARRGNCWTTIVRMVDSGTERVIAESDLSDTAVSQARILLHTGGAGRKSEILLKKLELHAAEYSPSMPVRAKPLQVNELPR